MTLTADNERLRAENETLRAVIKEAEWRLEDLLRAFAAARGGDAT